VLPGTLNRGCTRLLASRFRTALAECWIPRHPAKLVAQHHALHPR
jgi:hypothetical protein